MKVVVSSDMHDPLIESVLKELESRKIEATYIGPVAGDETDWPDITMDAARMVASGSVNEAIVFCWTGTGASIAANKIGGIRAALCSDRETAKGARIWNHANVLAMSIRSTSPAIAKEILDGWFSTPLSDDEWNRNQVAKVSKESTNSGIRDMLIRALAWDDAHGSLESLTGSFPVELAAETIPGEPHSPWQILEHIRICQEDILDFATNPKYKYKKWPDDYWPKDPKPPSPAAWAETSDRIIQDRNRLTELIEDTNTSLTEIFRHGRGENLIREVLLVIDHTAYHLGQLTILKKYLTGIN